MRLSGIGGTVPGRTYSMESPMGFPLLSHANRSSSLIIKWPYREEDLFAWDSKGNPIGLSME